MGKGREMGLCAELPENHQETHFTSEESPVGLWASVTWQSAPKGMHISSQGGGLREQGADGWDGPSLTWMLNFVYNCVRAELHKCLGIMMGCFLH